MTECAIVLCDNADEVARARGLWEGKWGFTLLPEGPADLFPSVKVYDFDPAATTKIFPGLPRHVLMFTKAAAP